MTEQNLRVVLFVSRNKDNKEVEGFKERSYSFLTKKQYNSVEDILDLLKDFHNFVNKGVLGETSRFYFSVNGRSSEKTNKQLIHYLVDHPDINSSEIPSKTVSLASQVHCAVTKKWLFDFDIPDYKSALNFKKDVHLISGISEDEITIHKTMNNFAIITPHGFDTRQLLTIWNIKETTVELKRDGLLLVDWSTIKS